MSPPGSNASRVLHPALALTVTLAGVAAMMVGAVALARSGALGLRAQIAAGSALLALPTIAILLLLRRHTWRETLRLSSPAPRTLALSALLGGALWVLSIGLMELQSLALPPPPEYLEAFRAIHRALAPENAFDALVSLTVIAIAPGVGEEIVTRGILLPSLVRPLGRALAVLASAFLFAAMHADLYRFLFTFTIGAFLGTLRLRAGSLWPPIVAHVTLNTLTFVIAPLVDDPSQTIYAPQPALGVACLLAGIALTLPLLKAFRRADPSQTDGLC